MAQLAQKALLYINDKNARGTAFLIDRRHGLYLTAAHVVAGKGDYSDIAIRQTVFLNARNPLLSDHQLSVQVIAFIETQRAPNATTKEYELDDLAILQLRNFELPEDARALELALRQPKIQPRERVRYTGYGTTRPESPHPRIIDDYTFALDQLADHVYRIATGVDGGDSGGPVFLENGNVIGFVIRAIGSSETIVHPLSRYVHRIMTAVGPEGDRILDVLFSEDPVAARIEQTTMMLRPGSESVSNLELASAASELHETKRLGEIEDEVLDCPLSKAADQREIGLYGSPITYESFRRKFAAASPAAILQKAAAAEQSGDANSALALYDLARDGYRREVAQLMATEASQRAVAGSLYRVSGSGQADQTGSSTVANMPFPMVFTDFADRLDIEPANVVIDWSPNNAARYRTFTSDRLAVALNDYGRALSRGNSIRANIMGAGFVDRATQETAVTATSVGALVAGNPIWKQLNLDTLEYSLTGRNIPTGVENLALAEEADDRRLLDLVYGEEVRPF